MVGLIVGPSEGLLVGAAVVGLTEGLPLDTVGVDVVGVAVAVGVGAGVPGQKPMLQVRITYCSW